ncbi:MAG: ThuA domain-containing protein [Bacteroidia bacterium]|nr:ThuA domain-containing protein [Bacteroidia bacterium]
MRFRGFGRLALLVALAACARENEPVPAIVVGPAVPNEAFRVLVFAETAGFRHASIEDGVAMLRALGEANGFGVDYSEHSEHFVQADLTRYAAVVFVSPTGDVLNASEQTAFEAYIRSGGGFVGIHAASDCEYAWSWYGQLVGRYFAGHPAIQTATVNTTQPDHPLTDHLAGSESFTDEWYNFGPALTALDTVLQTVDETTYAGGTMGANHPITWYKTYDGGRSFYTALGHTEAQYTDPRFRELILRAVHWAAGD